MTGAFRWQVLIPRLISLAIVAMGCQYGLGIFVRTLTMYAGEKTLGVPVDVSSSRVSLLEHEVTLNNLRLADPHHPAESLIEADHCVLNVAGKPLLRRQIVANRGRLSGLQLTTDPSDAHADRVTLDKKTNTKWFQDDADAVASQWLAQLAQRFRQSQPDQFESVRRTEEFCEAWSNHSAKLDARGKDLSARVAELHARVEASQSNPLRYREFQAQLPNEIAALQKDVEKLSADLEKLPDQLDGARRKIVAVRRNDEQLAARKVTLDPIEANAISAYLLRDQATKPLDQLVEWLRWARVAVPAGPATYAKAFRGENLLFAGTVRQPTLVIRALDLQGFARISNQPVELRGLLTDYTSNPALHSEPMRLRLTTTGSMPIELQAVIDRTHGVTRDSVVVDCQSVLIPKLTLGRTEQIQIAIEPSHATLSISASVDGDRLTGDIQLVQREVRITPTSGGEFGNVPIASALGDTLGRIDSLATRISLGGTLANPTCKMWSNLGPAVAESMERAAQRANGQHTRALLVEAGQKTDERLTNIERQMTDQQARWASQFAEVQAELQAVAKNETPRDRISTERLGRRLPVNSLFR